MANGQMTGMVHVMLDHREKLLEAFEEVCPKLEGRTLKAAFDDRRDMYWRLADGEVCLVYSEEEANVTSAEPSDEYTFVDEVICYWRPEGESFVLAFVNTAIGDPDVVAFLSTSLERPL